MNGATIKWDDNDDVLLLRGNLTLASLPFSFPAVDRKLTRITLDLSRVSELDTSGANAVLSYLGSRARAEDISLKNSSDDYQKIFTLVIDRSDLGTLPSSRSRLSLVSIIEFVGKVIVHSAESVREYISLIGQLCIAVGGYIVNPGRIRVRELFAQIDQAGIRAIPVVALVTFLIGVVLAYLLAMQAEKFGASIFVIDGLALAMCREMSPILVAIIIAGRSGSAFTAQLGAMKLTEEIDALKSIGLRYFDVLIFPRIIALLLVMPLLVFVGDIVGIYGGMLITENYLGLSSTTFYERLSQVLTLRHASVGFIKAPVFALAIGMIACRVGMNVPRDARSVGLSTTKTVVESIVVVILLNAAFAVIFAQLGF